MDLKQIEIFFRKLALKIFLNFKSVKEETNKIVLDEKSKVLILRLNKIGDALATTPLISLLKEKTNCEITILADTKNHFIFDNNQNVTMVIIFDKKKLGIGGTSKLLNANDFDVIIDSHSDVSTTLSFLVGLSNAKYKVALRKNNRKLFTHSIESKTDIHIIDEVLLLAEIFNFEHTKENTKIEYNPSIEARQAVVDFIIENKLDRTKPLVGINISAGSNSRYWGTDRFNRLVKYLENYDIEIIILHSPKDTERALRISRKNSTVFSDKSFDEFTSMIYELDFLFTPDTSAVQLASSKKTPMFILYVHKATAKKWCPYNSAYDCAIIEDENFARLSFGRVLNSFVSFFDNFYKEHNGQETLDEK